MTALDILAFGAHPDDVEIGMAGLIAKMTAAGSRIGICDLTQAEMSSNGTVEQRQREAAEASEALGLAARSCLALPDRGLAPTEAHIAAIVKEIRTHRPRLVFAPFWDDRHPDHVACSRLVEEAAFNAKLRRYMPELPPVQVEQVIFYYINDMRDVSLMVDVSAHYDRKLAALSAYRSQFEPAAEGSGRVSTPLTERYVQNVEARDRLLGGQRQWAYAEGFAVKRPFGIETF